MEPKCRKLIIDCDPGIDDAFALAYALKQKDIEILGITTTAGNVPLDKTARNALIIGDLLGRRVPVYPGEKDPMTERISPSDDNGCHGEDGLGDIGLKPSERKPEEKKAADFILETLSREEARSVDIICLGPLTNIALAVKKDPDCVKKAGAVYSMGGSVLCGNATPVAEFNYWMDPIAADIVYNSGIPIYMVGLNLCSTAPFPPDIREKMKSAGPEVRLLEQMLGNYGESHDKAETKDIVLYDLIAMIASLSTDIVKWLHCRVDISTAKVTRGECIADLVDAWKKEKNCFYAQEIDEQRLWELFCNTFLPV